MDPAGARIQLAGAVDPSERVLLIDGDRPIGWGRAQLERNGSTACQFVDGRLEKVRPETLAAWLVPAEAVTALADAWPADAAPHAVVETVSPGGRAAWLRMPGGWCVGPPDRFWLRAGGQPIARLDVRSTSGPLVYCDVVQLARDARVREQDRVALWRDRGALGAASAVCFVEPRAGSALVWIAAPRGGGFPEEPRIEIRRDGRFVADGIVERRGERFWYARLEGAADASAVQVGDDAVVRTEAMLAEGRFAARVFESRPEGYLINAGELDRVHAGQAAAAYRDGQPIAEVSVTRVQRGYSVVRSVSVSTEIEPAELQAGDEVRFAPPPAPPRVLGRMSQVVDGSLLSVTVQGAVPLLTPLAVRDDAGAAGVAVLLCERAGVAVGFVIEESIARPLAAGMRIDAPAEATP
jgi:hypothetical protein